jgi:hypothetical protein
MNDFYASTDALDFDKALSFFSKDAEVVTWAEGVDGRHWHERHYRGPNEIRSVLNSRGLRRVSESPNSPRFLMTEVRVSRDRVSLMLRPDRLSADKRPYNPYRVDVVFENCRMRIMTVIEYISWE